MMGMNVGNGGDFESSGEKYAMGYVKNLLKNIDKPVLFDVGANRGDYAKELVIVSNRRLKHLRFYAAR